MGNIIQKLEYLEDTKAKLRAVLEEMGAEVTDEDTFASYAEKFKNATPDTNYINEYYKYITKQYPDMSYLDNWTVNGVTTDIPKTPNIFICPRINIVIPEKYQKPDSNVYSFGIPYAPKHHNAYNKAVTVEVVDYSTVTSNYDDILPTFYLHMIRPEYLVLPNRVFLNTRAVYNWYTATVGEYLSFSGGLYFGEYVYCVASNWIYSTLSTTQRKVYFPVGFRVRNDSILYLNKIYITQACLQEMVQNLYDYPAHGDTTTRTISLGTTNKALLTADEIALALSKGWNIT